MIKLSGEDYFAIKMEYYAMRLVLEQITSVEGDLKK